MNSVNIIGRLGRDPETRYTAGGTAVSNFSLAVDEYRKNNSGEGQKSTHWFSVVAWAKTAGFAGEYLRKGAQVGVTGRLQEREWKDKDGNKRKTVEIVAERITLVGPKPEGGDAKKPAVVGEEDIPF